MDTIVFTGGGTGGHIFPGLAIVEILQSKHPAVRCVWFGSSTGMDRVLVEAASLPFYGIPSGKLRRYFSLRNGIDVFKIIAGFFVSLYHLARIRPYAVFSKGGFVSVPPCMAAAFLRIPVFTHECDVTPGLATRLIAPVAQHIFVSYEKTGQYFPQKMQQKIRYSGNPVRPVFSRADAQAGRAFTGFSGEDMPILFVQGGSLGARQINTLIRDIIPQLHDICLVVHQTGAGNNEPACSAGQRNDRYRTYEFIRSEMPHVLASADLVVSRSGANSVWECATAGKPMILIPLEAESSRGDQIDNARFFEEHGAAVVLCGKEATAENLVRTITQLLENRTALSVMADASRALGAVHAAEYIADELVAQKNSQGGLS